MGRLPKAVGVTTPGQQIQALQPIIQQAKSKGLTAPSRKTAVSALQGLSRVLNIGVSPIAGAARGLLTGQGIIGGIKSGVKENIGYADVIKAAGVDTKNPFGRFTVGAAGFVADVLFDPMTYLTFGLGRGLKVSTEVGEKVLSEAGTKVAQKASREATESLTKRFVANGMEETAARKLAQQEAERVVQRVATGAEKGLTSELARKLGQTGVAEDTLAKIGPDLIDRGGIKFAGRTLVTSEKLANTAVGRAARAIGQSEVVKAISEPLGKMFKYDFGKNPELMRLLEQGNIAKRRAIRNILDENSKIFKGVNDAQMKRFFDTAFEMKKSIVPSIDAGATRREAKAILSTKSIIPQFKDDPRLQQLARDLFEGPDAVVKKLAKEAGLKEEDAIKFYLPSIFKDKMTIKDWATGGKLSGVDAGYLKEFKGVETPNLVRDPFKALSTRQIQVAGMNIKRDTAVAVVRGLGVPIDAMTAKQAAKNGFEKFSRTFGTTKVEGWLPKDLIEEINKFLSPEYDSIDKLAKAIGFDYATGLWKGYVTSLFPAFHIRNVTSNVFQNMLKIGVDAVNPFLHKKATQIAFGRNLDDVIVTKTGKKMTLGELRDAINKESDILDAGAFGSAEMLVDEARGALGKGTLRGTLDKINPLSQQNIALQTGQKVGQKFENQARLVNILSNVMEGKSIKDAIKVTEEALFNYGKLTDFERKVMRRLIPFYSFARFNMGLQLSALAHTPGRVAAQLKGIRGASNVIGGDSLTEEDKKGLPSYVLSGLGIKAGVNQYGQQQFMTGFGLPIEQFLSRFSGERSIIWNVVRNTINEANPILKYNAERALDIDLFRDRPIAELDNAQDLKSMIDSMPAPVAKQFKELINFVELPNQPIYANGKVVGRRTIYRANPYYLHFIRSLPTGRVTATMGMTTDETQTTSAKWLRLLTGVKASVIDQQQQQFYNDLKYKQDLEKWLTRAGFGKIYEQFYQPKPKKLTR